ncbi:MAG: TetR family transcriptional regulator [Solirubrobacteraceae bacterium]
MSRARLGSATFRPLTAETTIISARATGRPTSSPHTGRRPGDSGTREAIVQAARAQFAEGGFDRTSIRAIASQAGVDPALVTHYFGSKQALFVSVVELPYDPSIAFPAILSGDRDGIGLRLAQFVVGLLEAQESRERIVGIVRAAASEPQAARLVRDLIVGQVFAPMVESLEVDDAPLRASLVGSQVVGLVVARYVTGVEPLASLDPDAVARAIAPTFQRYLVEAL